jgi:hypothetical protein
MLAGDGSKERASKESSFADDGVIRDLVAFHAEPVARVGKERGEVWSNLAERDCVPCLVRQCASVDEDVPDL